MFDRESDSDLRLKEIMRVVSVTYYKFKSKFKTPINWKKRTYLTDISRIQNKWEKFPEKGTPLPMSYQFDTMYTQLFNFLHFCLISTLFPLC